MFYNTTSKGDLLFKKYSDEWDLNPPNSENALLKIMVMGEFNAGKSSLTNALIGKDVLPVDIFQTTATINRIVSGYENGYEVIGINGEVLGKSSNLSDLTNFNADYGQFENVRWINITLKDFPSGIELIDTPGFNDPNPVRDQIFLSIVPTADIIIFVSDANQALKGSEIPYIEKFFLGCLNRVYFVFNQSDNLQNLQKLNIVRMSVDKSLNELVHKTSELFARYECSDISPEFESQNIVKNVFFLSAITNSFINAAAISDKEFEKELLSNFEHFKEKIFSLTEYKDSIVEDIKITGIIRQLEEKRELLVSSIESIQKAGEDKQSLHLEIKSRISNSLNYYQNQKKKLQEIPDTLENILNQEVQISLTKLENNIKSLGDDWGGAYANQYFERELQGIVSKLTETVKTTLTTELSLNVDVNLSENKLDNQAVGLPIKSHFRRGQDLQINFAKAGLAHAIAFGVAAVFLSPIAAGIAAALVGGVYQMNSVREQRVELDNTYNSSLENIKNTLNNIVTEILNSVQKSMKDYEKEILKSSENLQWQIIELCEFALGHDPKRCEGLKILLDRLEDAIQDCNNELINLRGN